MRLHEARKRLPVLATPLPRTKGRGYHLVEDDTEAPRPALAVWEFTLACDQRCLHCGPRAAHARPDELTTEEALRLVDDLADLGVGEVVLIGGEAYLRADVLLVIRRVRERGMTCSLTTGGYGLTQTRAEALVEAGVQSVNVSIDGMQQTHDFVRNRPHSWERAFAAIAHLRAAGAKVAVNTQINRRSRDELLALLPLLADAGIWAWQLQITCPHGNAVEHDDLVLQPYHFLELFETLDRVLEECEQRGIVLWPGNNLGYFGPFEHRLRRRQKRASGHFTGCHAGHRTIAIESNGVIKNCPSLGGAENTGGSWRELDLKTLWAQSKELRYFRERTLDDLWGYCRDCYYAETCMSGCTAASEPLLGRPGNNPFCHHRALEMDRQGLRERIELVRGADSDQPFSAGLFRVIREPVDPERRRTLGAVSVDEPRVSRREVWRGPGHAITPDLP